MNSILIVFSLFLINIYISRFYRVITYLFTILYM